MRDIIRAFFLGLALPALALAQDYRHLAPQNPENPASPAVAPEETASEGGDQKIFIPHLKAMVFWESPDPVQSEAAPATGLQTHGIAQLEKPEFKALVEPYIDQPLSIAKLNQLLKEIVLYYRKNDRPVVDVVVPEQDITGGVLQLVVIEGRAGKIDTDGNRWFSSDLLLGDLRIKEGDAISARKL